MIVGSVNLDKQVLISKCKTPEDIRNYAISLIPEEFRHVEGIIDNQIYFICLSIRKTDEIKWQFKRPLIDTTLKNVKIVGYVDSLVEVRLLYSLVNKDRILKYKKGEL